MGQYYVAFIANTHGGKGLNDKHIDIMRPSDYGNGLKLMEHAWIGNGFVNAVCSLLEAPCHVLWAGDYASYVPEEEFHGEDYKLCQACAEVANRLDEVSNRYIQPIRMNKDSLDWFIVNEDRYQYIDIAHYYADNIDNDGWCIHPLPLLTAIGNGCGGGDYRGINMETVGIWAMNRIYVTQTRPQYGEEITFNFKEEY